MTSKKPPARPSKELRETYRNVIDPQIKAIEGKIAAARRYVKMMAILSVTCVVLLVILNPIAAEIGNMFFIVIVFMCFALGLTGVFAILGQIRRIRIYHRQLAQILSGNY